MELIEAVRKDYQPFAEVLGAKSVTDTLVTKIIMGTFGCLPACDQYFILGFRSYGACYSSLNEKFIERILCFCQKNLTILKEEQESIVAERGTFYPLMKIIDMYFVQLGHETKDIKEA